MMKFVIKSEYWDQFSDKQTEFENEVRKGIWFRADDESMLPDPPEGYSWVLETGGISFSSKVTYRLWSAELGYMPGSE